jgi:hypothetical protein
LRFLRLTYKSRMKTSRIGLGLAVAAGCAVSAEGFGMFSKSTTLPLGALGGELLGPVARTKNIFPRAVPPIFLFRPQWGLKVMRVQPECIRPIDPCREAAREQSCAGHESKACSAGSVSDASPPNAVLCSSLAQRGPRPPAAPLPRPLRVPPA